MINNTLKLNKNIAFKASYEWLKDAFKIFREAPLQFIVLTIISGLCAIAPILGAFMTPFFTARFAVLASSIESGQQVSMSSLFQGFFSNRTNVRLAYISMLVSLILMVVEHYFIHGMLDVNFSLTSILFLLVILIIQTFFWISPIICEYHPEVSVKDAMLLSFEASMYNIATMILYSILVLAFTLLSIIPLGLGLFVLFPVVNISSYFIYKSFYLNAQPI